MRQVPRRSRTKQDEQAGRRRHDRRSPTCSPGAFAAHPCARQQSGGAWFRAALLPPVTASGVGLPAHSNTRHLHKVCIAAIAHLPAAVSSTQHWVRRRALPAQ